MQVEAFTGDLNSSVNHTQNEREDNQPPDLSGEITANTLKIPDKIGAGTIIPGLINAATWRDELTRGVFIFGRQMLGRGDGVPDPSNSVLIICDNQGNVLRNVVVFQPNEKGEQFEDWRADITDRGTVILGATWTEKTGPQQFQAQMAWMEVSSNWDGKLGEVRHMPEADPGKNATPWHHGTRMLFRRDDSPHAFDDYIINDDRLHYAGEVHMPGNVTGKFRRSGTTFAPTINNNGDGVIKLHFQELMPDGRIVYRLGEAPVHMNGRLQIGEVNLSRTVAKSDFQGLIDIPELRKDIPIEVIYQTGQGCINIADKATLVTGLPR